MNTDWEGRPVPEGESPSKVVLAWEVEPHPDSRYYMYVERSWQKMLAYVRDNLEGIIENRPLGELLNEEFVLKIRLRKWAIEDLPEPD